jgi:coenzyme F420-reducing hydrogenase delta subunit/ferredoxin
MAGTTRRAYPATVRMLRLPCTGRANPLFILKAFEQGADGVLVSGCHPGDCHYVQGNFFARRRFAAVRALLDFVGLDPRRLHFSWVSASEGLKWAQVVEDATREVTAAGPLGRWAAPPDAAPPEPPPWGTPPREPAGDREAEQISEHLRTLAASLLDGGDVTTVIGHTPGPLAGQWVPTFVTKGPDAARIGFSKHAHSNLAAYLGPARRPAGKLAVVLKPCDARTVLGLLQEGQVRREDATLIGVSCAGLAEAGGTLSPKCWSCDGASCAACDYVVDAGGATKRRNGAPVSAAAPAAVAARATAPDPRDARIAWIESLPSEQRRAWWQEQFARCLRCHACRAACPMCYCGTCITEQHRPQWIPASIGPSGNTAWNIVRAYHMSGRCGGCDECARVCPAKIDLDLINRRVAREIEERFGYRAGQDPSAAPPLATFSPDDPQEFIW